MPELHPNYPNNLDTKISLIEVANNAVTTVSEVVSSSATIIPVISTILFPNTGLISISNEVIKYSGKTASSFTGCVRGVDNTFPSLHNADENVEGRFVAAHHSILSEVLLAVEQKLGRGSSTPSENKVLKGTLSGSVWASLTPNEIMGLSDYIVQIIENRENNELGSKSYVHTQSELLNTWVINHNLSRYPEVIILDNSNVRVYTDIEYTSVNQLILRFRNPFSGIAYLN